MSSSVQINVPLDQVIDQTLDDIQKQLESRAYRAANEMRNSAMIVLRGQRSGRRYKVPGTFRRQLDKDPAKDPSEWKKKNGRYYTASAPGEPPAVRTGTFRNSWQPTSRVVLGTYISRIESDVQVGTKRKYLLGELLEDGTPNMEARPHHDRIRQHAEKAILRIYNEPYQ